MTLAKYILALRQRAATRGAWQATGCEILDDQLEPVARTTDPATAAYLTDMHNTFIPLANAWLMTKAALRDRAAMTRLMEQDRGA